jgi:hypothetical protein
MTARLTPRAGPPPLASEGSPPVTMIIRPIPDEPPADPRRSYSLIGVVVVAGILGIGALVLIPAIHASREAVRASQFT